MEKTSDRETEPILELLRRRAELSAKTLTDAHLLEWIVEISDLLFDNYKQVYIAAAENPNINLRTSLLLASNGFAEVRQALLRNPALPAGILYSLALDKEVKIREAAEAHANMVPALHSILRRVKARHSNLFMTNEKKGRSLLSSYGVFVIDEETSDFYSRNALLAVAYKEESYWRCFADSTGYTVWYLKQLVEEIMNIQLDNK